MFFTTLQIGVHRTDMDESRLQKILDASPDMYLIIDRKGILVDFKPSRNFEPVLPPNEFLGKPMEDVLPGELVEAALTRVRDVLKTGRESLLEYSLPADGVPHYYEARFTLFDEKHVLAIIRDATDRKRSMQASQALINASEDLFLLLDRQGYIMSINQSTAGFYGKTPQQMEGTLYWDYVSPETANIRKERLEGIFRSGEPTQFIDLSGERIFEVTCNPVHEPAGAVLYVAYFIKEITDQVEADQGLIESEARHRRLFDENPVPMYIYDTETLMIMDANAAMIDSYGYARDELTTMAISDIRPMEDVSRVLENVTDLRSKQVYLGIWRHTKKDGSVIDVEITSGDFPFQSRPARLVLCNDVTEKVRIQKAMEESAQQYRHLFEHNPLPMIIFDPETMKFLNVNLAAVNHYGYEKEEFLNMTIQDLRPPEDVEEALKTIRSMKSTEEKVGVFRHRKKDGTRILVDIISHEINYEGQKARLVLCNDVTDQIQARKALEESEVKFRSVVESSPMGIHMYRLQDDNRLIFSGANPAADRILGVDHSQFEGLTLEEAFPGSENSEIPKRYREVCLSGKPWHNEQINYEDDQISGAFEVYAFQTGQRAMSVLFLEVTEKKKAAEALLKSEEQLRASLGEKEILLKEIHHRVKNNLQVISGLLDLQAHHISDPESREIYKESQNRVVTMALIHEELYQSVNLSQVDFADYIRNLCENLLISYGADQDRIKLDINTEKTEMVADTAIPCGLIINELITNCLKHAFPGERRGTISLSFKQLKSKDFLLTVSDDGVGIPEDVDITSTNTLGMQLVTVLVGQLGGTLKVKRRNGIRFTIRFKEYHEAGSVLY
jgi:PAS domain S-box-containing protein